MTGLPAKQDEENVPTEVSGQEKPDLIPEKAETRQNEASKEPKQQSKQSEGQGGGGKKKKKGKK